MKTELEKKVKQELSGEIAKSYVTQIASFHRVQASSMFHEAAEYVKKALHDVGLKNAKIEQFPSDGKTKYWTWVTPIGWEVKSAEISLVEPKEILIVRYDDTPTCLHTYSKGTSPEGITAELVDVGEGTKPEHYRGKKVKGKFVLATGKAKEVHEQAVFKYQAAAVITDTLTLEMKDVRESIDIPNAHAYQSIWPTKEDLNNVTFGFSLSKRQGNHLRALLRSGKPVKLKAKVDANLFSSNLDVVTATIQGNSKPDEEVFLIAHLCHPKPSANDNASGSGLLLEIARTIQTLIKEDQIKKPARTIRFLWVPETFGTIAYLYHHEDLASKLVAGINLDMVGQNQEICKSTLNLDRTPDSNPSYLNDFVFSLFERSVKEFDSETAFGSASVFRYAMNTFSGGSDHAEFNDSTFGVPCVMLLQWPDLYYHTNMDSIEKVSEHSLKRVGWIATVAALTLAQAKVDDVYFMANLTRLGGITRIGEASKKTIEEFFRRKLVSKPKDNLKVLSQILFDFKDRVGHIVWREKMAIKSTLRLGSANKLERIIAKYMRDIDEFGESETKRVEEIYSTIIGRHTFQKQKDTKIIKEAKHLIPKRLFKAPLSSETFRRFLGEEKYEWYQKLGREDREFRKKIYELVNFIDGKRTVNEIAKAVSAEYSETDLKNVLKFIYDLEKGKFISFR